MSVFGGIQFHIQLQNNRGFPSYGQVANIHQQSGETSDISHEEEGSLVEFDMDTVDEMDQEVESDGDSPGMLIPGDVNETLSQLGQTADRVSQQIEEFAKNLDQLNPMKSNDIYERRRSALALVVKYRHVAESAWDHLHRTTQKFNRQRQNENDDSSDEGRQNSESQTLEEMNQCTAEIHTWRLFEYMLDLEGLNYPIVDGKPVYPKQDVQIHRYSPENDLWVDFMNKNPDARERQTVLRWLEEVADETREDIDTVVDQLEAGSDRQGLWTNGWLYTKEEIKKQKRLRSWPQPLEPNSPGINKSHVSLNNKSALATQLDPDAASRQQHALTKEDQNFEKAIWLGCWEMLRRGKGWKDVSEWCKERVEGWRAISIRPSFRGLRLLEESLPSGEDNSPALNYQSRTLWRHACRVTAMEGTFDDYENGVYGLLSGDFPSVEKVCRNWDDLLYATYNSLVLAQFDSFLQSTYPSRFPPTLRQADIARVPIDPHTTTPKVISSLAVHEVGQEATKDPFKMIHAALIGKSFADFAIRQGAIIGEVANADTKSNIIQEIPNKPPGLTRDDPNVADNAQTLRIMAHMLLILQSVLAQQVTNDQRIAIDNVVVAYIQFLKISRKMELIPLYASFLDEERKRTVLGRVFIDVTDFSERQVLVKLMDEFKINVLDVVTTQLQLHRNDASQREENTHIVQVQFLEKRGEYVMPVVKSDFIGNKVNDDAELIIRCFEWYLHLKGHWRQTMKVGAILYRTFFVAGQLAAARQLSIRVPFSKISETKMKHILGRPVNLARGFDNPDADIEEEMDEDMTKSTRSRPRQRRSDDEIERERMKLQTLQQEAKTYYELESLINALDALDTWKDIEDQINAEVKPSHERSWKGKLQRGLDEVILAVEPLLGDWLLHSETPYEEKQLGRIRKGFLPSITIAYLGVLYYAGHSLSRDHLLRAMDLATRIAAPGSPVAEAFLQAGRMRELVDVLAIASKAVLAANEVGGKAKVGRKVRREGWGERIDVWTIGKDAIGTEEGSTRIEN
ncbi:MAG: Nucleoporin nup84 [Cirrosporium novae-zelandiae]|nr:MAG: Nucleoporin nup84 [Cirrosporium novae-zelandiae]